MKIEPIRKTMRPKYAVAASVLASAVLLTGCGASDGDKGIVETFFERVDASLGGIFPTVTEDDYRRQAEAATTAAATTTVTTTAESMPEEWAIVGELHQEYLDSARGTYPGTSTVTETVTDAAATTEPLS